MPAGLPVEVIAKVPSRYYRVPQYFFPVLTVAHNRWYRPILLCLRHTTLYDKTRFSVHMTHYVAQGGEYFGAGVSLR